MQLEDLQYITIDGDEIVSDKSGYRNFSKDIALTIGYLLGVREDFLEKIVENSEEYYVENFEVKDDHYNIKTHSDYVKHGLQAFYGDSPEDWGTKVN